MKRIYSNYSEEEYQLMLDASTQMGISLSAYQKYCSLLRLKTTNTFSSPDLIQKLLDSLKNFDKGVPFVVASLLPDKWVSLTRSQKITLSKKLSKEIKANPCLYKKVGVLNGNISQYIKL